METLQHALLDKKFIEFPLIYDYTDIADDIADDIDDNLEKKDNTADISISEDGLRVSEKEYWEKYYEHPDFNYEWNNGILEEKPMADYKSFLMFKWFFLSLLEQYLTVNPIADIVGLEIGFKLSLPDKTAIRIPDLAVILKSNITGIDMDDRSYKGTFDMCFEFLSDSSKKEVERDTIIKKYEYSEGGVKEYYILDREGKETHFYRLEKSGVYSPITQKAGGVIQSRVLPGFKFRVKDLYQRPSLKEMIEDEIYKPFVYKDFQLERKRADDERKRADEKDLIAIKERKRADDERKRADDERKRADEKDQAAIKERKRADEKDRAAIKEHKRAEKLAEQLRALGVEPYKETGR